MRPEQSQTRSVIDLRSLLDWLWAATGRAPQVSGLPAALAARTVSADRGGREREL